MASGPKGLSRRAVIRVGIQAGAAVALLGAAGCDDGSADPEAPPFEDRPESEVAFPLGVQAGGMTATGVVLWTWAPTASTLALRVWPAEAEADEQPTLEVVVSPEAGYAVIELEGLEGGRWWRYAFYDDEAQVRSKAGRVQTAFAEGARALLRVGATACTSVGRAPFNALQLLARADLDVFCHLGDMSYNDGAETAEDYREQWRRLLALPGYQALLPSVGSYVVWDDHEVANDDELYALDDAWRLRGRRAFFEHVPMPAREIDGRPVYWRSFRWGATAEFFVLDCRLERRPETREGPDAEYISPAQFEWLTEALAASPCHFKVLLNSVPIAGLPDIWGDEADRWAGYPAQREALLSAIESAGLENVWWLAGDFHLGAVWRVEPDGPRSAMWEIACGPGGSAPSRRQVLAERTDASYALFYPPEQAIYGSGRWAATVLEFDPEADTVRVIFIDAETEEVVFDQTLTARPR